MARRDLTGRGTLAERLDALTDAVQHRRPVPGEPVRFRDAPGTLTREWPILVAFDVRGGDPDDRTQLASLRVYALLHKGPDHPSRALLNAVRCAERAAGEPPDDEFWRAVERCGT